MGLHDDGCVNMRVYRFREIANLFVFVQHPDECDLDNVRYKTAEL